LIKSGGNKLEDKLPHTDKQQKLILKNGFNYNGMEKWSRVEFGMYYQEPARSN
jgi:hypothetical protein